MLLNWDFFRKWQVFNRPCIALVFSKKEVSFQNWDSEIGPLEKRPKQTRVLLTSRRPTGPLFLGVIWVFDMHFQEIQATMLSTTSTCHLLLLCSQLVTWEFPFPPPRQIHSGTTVVKAFARIVANLPHAEFTAQISYNCAVCMCLTRTKRILVGTATLGHAPVTLVFTGGLGL